LGFSSNESSILKNDVKSIKNLFFSP
jgi:hypothetical protein